MIFTHFYDILNPLALTIDPRVNVSPWVHAF